MPITTEPTASKYSEDHLQELTEKVIEICLSKAGEYVDIDSKHGKENQEEIFDRVRNIFKLMGLSYSIPAPDSFPVRSIDRNADRNIYKIKIMTDAQLETWRKDQKTNGPFSVRRGMREPYWFNDRMEFL